MDAPVYTYDELHSNEYRWRPNGKILAAIFSQTFPLGKNAQNKEFWKITEEDDDGRNLDVDFKQLQQLFCDFKKMTHVEVDVDHKPSLSFDKVKKYLKEDVNERKVEYDCFFFIFLTYGTAEHPKSFSEEKIHFDDKSIEKGVVPQAKILEEVNSMMVARGKPKIFLFQADDLSLLSTKQYLKGPTFVPDTITVKIPQDADRLIIKSTIPQIIANQKDDGESRTEEKHPSFMIKAFVETIYECLEAGESKREDLFSLTTVLNGKMAELIKKPNDRRPKKDYEPLKVALVTSTLTKGLHFQKGK